jgi:hypothetical protein
MTFILGDRLQSTKLEKPPLSVPDLQVLPSSQSTDPEKISAKNVRLPKLSLLESNSPRFRLIPGQKGIIRVDVGSARAALRHTVEKYADFFEI